MTADRWTLTLAGLLGEPWPMPPDLPGRVFWCASPAWVPNHPDDPEAAGDDNQFTSDEGPTP